MIALRTLSSAAAVTIYDSINAAGAPDQLDHLARLMWQGYGGGAISEDDATFLSSCIERRRPSGRTSATGHLKAAGNVMGRTAARLGSRFTPRQRPRCPNRKASRDRRRTLGGSSALPDNLRPDYTEGQRAVLCIVAGEVKRHGVCELPVDKIGALAGVCRTTVQTTLHLAKALAHIKITERPRPGHKHLTNVVQVIAVEWVAWIKRAPSAASHIGSNPVKMVSTTKNKIDDDGGDDARAHAREVGAARGYPSKEAIRFAAELATIVGYRGSAPPSWREAEPPRIVQAWLDDVAQAGCAEEMRMQPVEFLRWFVTAIMKRKRDRQPPRSPRYFTPEISKCVYKHIHLRAEITTPSQRRAG